MIAGLIGKVHGSTVDALLLNVNGVIYHVNTSGRTLSSVAEKLGEVELFTHLIVREDSMTLFGFSTTAELQWFDTLIGTKGVGPRLACAVLTRLSTDDLLDAINNERVEVLSSVSGIGKRTANQIILDLRGKLPENLDPKPLTARQEDPDVIGALQALGYTTSEIQRALLDAKPQPGATSEEQILAALRQLGGA